MSPSQIRNLIRSKKFTGNTSGQCPKHLQMNIVVIEKLNAARLEKFCKDNPVPCPVHYISAPNEFSAGHLCHTDTDIRTDLVKYCVIEKGVVSREVNSLVDINLKDYVTFYIGCSFSFEYGLSQAEVPMRHVEQNKNIAMYITNFPCIPNPPFIGNMIVSMRYIPHGMLKVVHDVCSEHPSDHGAPVWIGEPHRIGIHDLTQPDYGEYALPQEGDVPVFWGCGVTPQQVLLSAKLERVYTHSPGNMFICDAEVVAEKSTKSEMFVLREGSDMFVSFLSLAARDLISRLERLVGEDPGKRGIENLIVPNDLAAASLTLSHAESVAIVSEFPCNYEFDVPFETDGIPGVMSVAKIMTRLGKRVTLLYGGEQMETILRKCLSLFDWGKFIQLRSLSTLETDLMALPSNSAAMFDCLLTIEHSGPALDGNYYTMRGHNISKLCTPLVTELGDKKLFKHSIGIGDGGNEWGMGKVSDKVIKHINLGELIGCAVSADFLICAGVSNWGGYALAAAVLAARTCEMHRRYAMHGIGFQTCEADKTALFSKQEQRELLTLMSELGIRDGMKKELGLSVDGIDIEVHEELINEISKLFI